MDGAAAGRAGASAALERNAPAAAARRALSWAAGVAGGLCLLFAVAGGHLFGFGREASVEQMTVQFNRILRANGADDLLRQGLDVSLGEPGRRGDGPSNAQRS